MKYKKETPNKFVFEDISEIPKIPALYIGKSAFSGKRPDKIKVTVEEL